jgi:hypothetical protein
MNELNKKLKYLNKSRNKNPKLNRIHNINKDMRFWDWMYLEDENNELIFSAVLHSDNLKMYEAVISNSMNIPTKTGKNYGKK